MDTAGLIARILEASADIDAGRKGLAAFGEEHEGHLSYEKGITAALSTFIEVHGTADPHTILAVEEAFVDQDFQFCDDQDTDTRSSLIAALQSFDDAFRSYEAVTGSGYIEAEKTWPTTSTRYRINGYPKDAFHFACTAHQTRLRNNLRTPGINMTEKAVLKQRIANMKAASTSYSALQQKALDSSKKKCSGYCL
ncbi:hypothetical protein FACS1894163_07570 [Spirochaetia bacterium]|nr:hypothetical protein FACS1894163_07570 [Spirochaetia bacterium]